MLVYPFKNNAGFEQYFFQYCLFRDEDPIVEVQSIILTFQGGSDDDSSDLYLSYQSGAAQPSKCNFGRDRRYLWKSSTSEVDKKHSK